MSGLRRSADAVFTVQDVTITEGLCFYCARPAALRWPSGVLSCHHSVCKNLSYARDVGLTDGPDPTTAHRRHLRFRLGRRRLRGQDADRHAHPLAA